MKLHTLTPKEGSIKSSKRIARGQGSGRGGTSTRGHKGAKSRSGYSRKIGFEGGQMPLYRRVPKLKHFTTVNSKSFTVINVCALNEIKADSTVNLDFLVKQGLITSPKHPLKILGNGNLTVKLTIQASAFTSSARTKIEAAGGKCEILD